MSTHRTVALSPDIIAQVDLSATVDLAQGVSDILHGYGELPYTISLESDKPSPTTWLRQFSATYSGLHQIYRVRANLASNNDMFNGRPVVDSVDFFMDAADELIMPDSIVLLSKAFSRGRGAVGQIEAAPLLSPDLILRSLGQSVVRLSQGVNAAPQEYWNIADRA